MLDVLSTLVVAVAAVLSIPTFVLLIEIIAAIGGRRETKSESSAALDNTRVAILIPAHNESSSLLPTLQDIKPLLNEDDRLIVIADNCTDDTASIAAAAGAEVIIRNEPTLRGKGFALDWGIRFLRSNPPDFVIFIDGDCRVRPDAIARLKIACHVQQRPLQAVTKMTADPETLPDYGLSEFAWIIKNWVRPLGLWHLHCPSQLTGTSMIVPWEILQKVSLANGALAEDLQFGLDLAAARSAASFLPFVACTSEFPSNPASTETQRRRWVTGHINTITRSLFRYLALAIKQRNFDLLILCLDMAVPPLSLLAAAQVIAFTASSIILFSGVSRIGLIISGLSLFAFLVSIFLAWFRFGRDTLTAHSVSGIVPRTAATLRILALIFAGKAEQKWIRTGRKKGPR